MPCATCPRTVRQQAVALAVRDDAGRRVALANIGQDRVRARRGRRGKIAASVPPLSLRTRRFAPPTTVNPTGCRAHGCSVSTLPEPATRKPSRSLALAKCPRASARVDAEADPVASRVSRVHRAGGATQQHARPTVEEGEAPGARCSAARQHEAVAGSEQRRDVVDLVEALPARRRRCGTRDGAVAARSPTSRAAGCRRGAPRRHRSLIGAADRESVQVEDGGAGHTTAAPSPSHAVLAQHDPCRPARSGRRTRAAPRPGRGGSVLPSNPTADGRNVFAVSMFASWTSSDARPGSVSRRLPS